MRSRGPNPYISLTDLFCMERWNTPIVLITILIIVSSIGCITLDPDKEDSEEEYLSYLFTKFTINSTDGLRINESYLTPQLNNLDWSIDNHSTNLSRFDYRSYLLKYPTSGYSRVIYIGYNYKRNLTWVDIEASCAGPLSSLNETILKQQKWLVEILTILDIKIEWDDLEWTYFLQDD